MKDTLDKLIAKLRGLPWYFKVLFGLFFLIAIIVVGSAMALTFRTDQVLAPPKTSTKLMEDHARTIKKTIQLRKKHISRLMDYANKIDQNTQGNRERVREAKTLDELNALQKELGL